MPLPRLWELPWPLPVPIVQVLLWRPSSGDGGGASSSAPGGKKAGKKHKDVADKPSKSESEGEGEAEADDTMTLLATAARYAGCFLVALCASRFALVSDFGKIRRRPLQEWVAPLVLFNYASVVVLYGFWHWFLYCGEGGGPVLSKLRSLKLGGPEGGYKAVQGFVLTMLGVGVSTALEARLWYEVASGGAALQPGAFEDNWVRSAAMLMLTPMAMEGHAWLAHRILHPWGLPIPLLDPGNWLYRLVHWVRHESASPGPWTALAMHPLEHALVFSVYALPKLVPLHPLHIHFLAACSRIAPLAEHDGFARPAGGGVRRHHHHAHSEAGQKSFNYGGNDLLSLDEQLGTSWRGAHHHHDD